MIESITWQTPVMRKCQLTAMTALGVVFQCSAVYAQTVPAQCSPNPAVDGATVVCQSSGDVAPITTTANDFTLTVGTVTTPTAIVTSGAVGVNMSGVGSQTLNLVNSGSSVSAADVAAQVTLYGGAGDLTVNSEGILSARWSGLETGNFGRGQTDINLTGIALANAESFDGLAGYVRSDGVRAINFAAATDLNITSTGTINALNDGVWARNLGSGELRIDVENISSLNNRGVTALVDAGSGDLNVLSSGLISSAARDGVLAVNRGVGDTVINVNAITLTGGGAPIPTVDPVFGVFVNNFASTGNLSVTASGAIETRHDGIFVQNAGSGSTSVNVADITSDFGRGITAISSGTNGSGVNVTATGLIASDDEAVYVENNAGGETTINLNNIRSSGGSSVLGLTSGIGVVLTGDALGLDITATGTIETAGDGINVFNSGRRGTDITVNTLTTTQGTGIVVEQEGQTIADSPTTVAVTVTGRLESSDAALNVRNSAFGDTNIELNDVVAGYAGNAINSINVANGSSAQDLNLEIDNYEYIVLASDEALINRGVSALSTVNDGQGDQTINLETVLVTDMRTNQRNLAAFSMINGLNANDLNFTSEGSLLGGYYTVRNRGLGDTVVDVNRLSQSGVRVEHNALSRTGDLNVFIDTAENSNVDITSNNTTNHVVEIDRLINGSFSSFADRANLHHVVINSFENDSSGLRQLINFRSRFNVPQTTLVVNSAAHNTDFRINHFSGTGNLDVILEEVLGGSIDIATNISTDAVNLLVRNTIDGLNIQNMGGDLTVNVMGDGRGHANIVNQRLHPSGNAFAGDMNVQLGFMALGADIRNDGNGDTVVVSGGAMPWLRADFIDHGDRFIFANGAIRTKLLGIQDGLTFNDRGDAALRVLSGHFSNNLQLTTTGAVTGFEIVDTSYGIPDALHVMNFGIGTTIADIGGDVTGDGRAIFAASKEGATVVIRDGVTITGGSETEVAAVNAVIVSERPVGAIVFGGLADDATLQDYYTAFDHVPIEDGLSDRNTLAFEELSFSAATNDTLVLESNVTINGDILFGAGDDLFQTMTNDFDRVDGGAGDDTIEFFMPGFRLRSLNNTGDRLQGFENLAFSAGGYILDGTFTDLNTVDFRAGLNLIEGVLDANFTNVAHGAVLLTHAGSMIGGDVTIGGLLGHGSKGGEGLLSILGDFTQLSTGRLNIDHRTGDANVLVVGGGLNLAGRLSLQLNEPTAIGQVVLLDGTALAGTFDSVDGEQASNKLLIRTVDYDEAAFDVVLNTIAAAPSMKGLSQSEISLGTTLAHGIFSESLGDLAHNIGNLETDSQIKDALSNLLPTVAETAVTQFQNINRRHTFSMLSGAAEQAVSSSFVPQHVNFNTQSLTQDANGPAIWSRLQTTMPVTDTAPWKTDTFDTEISLGMSGLKSGGINFGGSISHLRHARPTGPITQDDVSAESIRVGVAAQYPINLRPNGLHLSLEGALSHSLGTSYNLEHTNSSMISSARSEEVDIAAHSSAVRLTLNEGGVWTLPINPYLIAGSDTVSRGVSEFRSNFDGVSLGDMLISAVDQTRHSYGFGAEAAMTFGQASYFKINATSLRYSGDTDQALRAQFLGLGEEDVPDFLVTDGNIRQQSIVDARLGFALRSGLTVSASGYFEFGDRSDQIANFNITQKW